MPDAPPETRAIDWFRTVTFHAVLAGLCPLIPVPFVDSVVLDKVRKRQVREVASAVARPLTEPQVAVLSGAARLDLGPGCVLGCLMLAGKVVFSLILRFFKKVVFFLTIKEAIDTASLVLHEGVLLHHGLTAHDVLPPADVNDERQAGARRLRRAMESATQDMEHRPINKVIGQIFRSNKEELGEGLAVLSQGRTKDAPDAPLPVDEEQQVLSGVTDRLVAALADQGPYFDALCARFDARLEEHAKEPATSLIATSGEE